MNKILRVFRRLHGSVLINKNFKDPGGCTTWIMNSRNKVDVAVLDVDKYSETTVVHSEISQNLTWLHRVAPGFPVDGSKITIIHDPKEFYSVLMEQCEKACTRITLASLYLGTGPLEKDLVQAISKSVEKSGGRLKVTVLLDYMRGTRGKCNSQTTLEPLTRGKFSKSCKIFLYHTPKLRGILKKIIPRRFNELIGLQHMKLYIFDDTLIISGANLSKDYFTNRQDRYFLIKDCKELCDFYNSLIERISNVSYRVTSEEIAPTIREAKVHPLKSSYEEFSRVAAGGVRSLFQDEMDKRNGNFDDKEIKSEADTWIFPLVEMGQLGIHHDSKVTLRLLQTAPPGSTLKLATGYFNLTSEYTEALLRHCQASCHLLTAHPTANGFFGAKGVAGAIPAAYTRIEESFLKKSEKLEQSDRISLWEFTRPGWTYHAKGLWYILPGHTKPSLTLIGSSNFGYRSVKRDLETQVAIVTKNEALKTCLQMEHERLFKRSKPVTKKCLSKPDRIAPAWVCAAVIFFRYYF